MISSNVNPSVSFNTGSRNYYTVDALRGSNSLQKYTEPMCTENSYYATSPYFNTTKPKKHLRRYMPYVPDKQNLSSMQYKNGIYSQTIDEPRYVGSYTTTPNFDEKISQPFHSSWQANTIDEKDIPLVEHALEDIHNKAKHYFALYAAERKRRQKLEETAYFFESGNQRLWETLQKETEKAHILIQTLESLKGDPRTLKAIIQRIDLIYIQLDTLVQSLAGLACFMAYKEQSKVETVNTVLDYLFPCKTLDPRLNALYGTTYYYKQSLSPDPDIANEGKAIEVNINEPNFGRNVETSTPVDSATETKTSNFSQSNVPLEGLQMHIHSISLTSLNESKKISCYFRYDNEAPQNAKKEEDRLLFESTIKNKANVDKTCILKSVPPKVAGKVPSYCVDIWLSANDVLHGTAACNVFDPSTLSKDSTWVVKDSTNQSIGFITVTILPVPVEAMLPALRYQLYKQATAKKVDELNKEKKSEHVKFETSSTHKSNKSALGSRDSELPPETLKKKVLVKKKQLLGPRPALLTVSTASSKTNTEKASSTKSTSTTKSDSSGHYNAEDKAGSNNPLEKNMLKKKSVENVVTKTTIQVKKQGSDVDHPPNVKETLKSTFHNIQEATEHKSETNEQNGNEKTNMIALKKRLQLDISNKVHQLNKGNPLEIIVTEPTSSDLQKPVPLNFKKPIALDSTKSPGMHLKKEITMGLNQPDNLQLKKAASFALEKSGLLESNDSNVLESTKPESLELKKLGFPELKKPGQLDFKKPGQLDFKKPGQLEFKKPGQLDFKKPGQVDFKKPGQLEFKKPGQLDFKKPGQLDFKKPGQLDFKKPGQLDFKKPGQLDFKKPGQVDFKKPGQLDFKKPGQLDFKKPGQLDFKKPGQLDFKKPVQVDLKKFAQPEFKEADQHDSKKHVQLKLQKQDPQDLTKPVHMDLKKPGQLDFKNPRLLETKKTSQLDINKDAKFNLKKVTQLDVRKPIILDTRKKLNTEVIHSELATKGKTKQEYMSKDKIASSSTGITDQSRNMKSSGSDAIKFQKTKFLTNNINDIHSKNKIFGNNLEKKVSMGQREMKNLTKNRSSDVSEIESIKEYSDLSRFTTRGNMKGSRDNRETKENNESKIKNLFLPKKKITNSESQNRLKRNVSLKKLGDPPKKKMGRKPSMKKLGKNSKMKYPSNQAPDLNKDIKINETSGEMDRSRFGLFKKLTKRLFTVANRAQ